MVDCPCHVWLQKKISMTHQQGTLKLYYLLLCTNVGDGILCALSTDHNIHGENGVYHWWTTYALKSKSVSEMHFPAIWRHKFTDLANSKKNLNLREKTAVDKSVWIKAWYVYVRGISGCNQPPVLIKVAFSVNNPIL